MPTLSNAELATLITRNHLEFTEWAGRIENQVKLTNGRVKELEKKEIGREAVAEYKSNQKADTRWEKSTVISILLVLASVAGVVAWVLKP